MKKLLPLLLLLTPFLAAAQPADSASVARQVDSLVQAAKPLIGQRKFDESLPLIEAAKKLALEKFGAEHPVYASCLFQQARVCFGTNKAADAERLYLEVKAIREKTFGKDHLDYAEVLNNLAIMYVRADRFDEAEQLHLEVKGIREKKLGKDHQEYINTLNNLGSVYFRSDRYREAEGYYLQVKAWREKNLGREDTEYARILTNLANLYSYMGRYEEAGRYYLEIKATQEKTMGKENTDYAFTLTYLGLLCEEMGRYEEAEAFLLEAKSIYGKVLGKDDPDYATSLENLAILYSTVGQYEAAEPLYLETQAIREKQLEKDHPDLAVTLNNLAVLYVDMNRRDTAEQFYLQAKSIFEKQGKESFDYAMSLNNLAILYKDMGRYGPAEAWLNEAKTIREKILGKEHPEYANTLEDLAALYEKMGRPEAALPLQQEAVAIFEKTLGKQHARYAKNLNSLAGLYEKLGKPEAAEPLLLEANALQRNLLVRSTHHFSERELAAYASLFAKDLDGFFSSARSRQGKTSSLPAACFDNALFHKGFLLTAASQVRHLALRDMASAKQYEMLAAAHRLLAEQYVMPIAEREGVAVLEQQANELEKELVRRVAGFDQATRQVTWQEVRDKLRPGEAAIEFVHYRRRNQEEADSVFYSALVLLPGDASPRLVHLCEEKSLDSLFGLHSERRSDFVTDLYSYQERGATPIGTPRKSLFELVWQPMEGGLKGAKTVYFSPSGLIHRLNLGAIPLNEEEVLADRINLVQLGSTRQLVAPYATDLVNQEALLVGGVQYDLDSVAIKERNIPTELLASRNSGPEKLKSSPTDAASRISPWRYLSWTNREVASIQPIVLAVGMSADKRTGHAATEEAFKLTGRDKPSPRSILLATHGFFFPDPKSGPSRATNNWDPEGPVFKMSDQPMIRSGLILAGGNYAWLNGAPLLPDMEDGILTAYEISQMDLSHTELVALSACETGLGDIKGNEGVYGLQRAFKIAGAKYIVMSLWEVPDQETAEFMTLFHELWLKEKMPVPDAFDAAQKEMRKIRFITPHQWAGFVLVE